MFFVVFVVVFFFIIVVPSYLSCAGFLEKFLLVSVNANTPYME